MCLWILQIYVNVNYKWVGNLSLHCGHFGVETRGKDAFSLKDCAFGRLFRWYQLEQISWECIYCFCSNLVNASRNGLCQQLMHRKSCMDFFFFPHTRIIFMSFSGVLFNARVLQTSEAFAVGRGWWLVVVGEGVVGESSWRPCFQIWFLRFLLSLFIDWEKSLNLHASGYSHCPGRMTTANISPNVR